MLITFCTKQMEWFGSFGLFFQGIYEDRTASSDINKLISGFLAIPYFEIANLFFKVRIFSNNEDCASWTSSAL